MMFSRPCVGLHCVQRQPTTCPRYAVYADSAYRSQEKEAQLAAANISSQISEKGSCQHPLTEEQKASNKTKSKVRVRVEHVFGAQAQMGGPIVRTIGLLRAQVFALIES